MKKVYFITRADDAGSSKSANIAIARAIKAGFIRNVSIMAPGVFTDEAAALFAHEKGVCFGMHGTLNAEWDRVKWRPVSDLGQNSGLVDEQGFFLDKTEKFVETKPSVALIMKEYSAQLDKLTRAGFRISYIDSHMFPEKYIPGLDEAVSDFAKAKGLLDHMYYYELPPGVVEAAKKKESIVGALRKVPSGQYFYLAHPAVYSEEMLQTGNSEYSGEDVANARAGEAKFLGSGILKHAMRLIGIRPLRYDEATPFETRLTVADVQRILS
ncbi:MAG: ChbG/HpnK family deacetylase [Clostridiales Family XIII bacterium]|jgi:predicted glycoside hydrolase/deacetylase ChbG (UPF0249 family)|nr:ChbG/HpnK family deacetylase [Clostridiales Family XIII bacterium]